MSEQKIVYVNKEISSYDDDFIGMASQVESIETAVEEGASIIGVIADYGSGKSSIGELIDGRKKFNDVIKVNMWDSLKENRNSSPPQHQNKEEDNILNMDKSFLYQISTNSGNQNLARHVNKRLSSNTGFISFTLKSKIFWLYFIGALILVTLGLLVTSSTFSFKIKEWVVNNNIGVFAYIVAIVILLVGLRKGSIAFSSWKSEGEHNLDTADIFSIYSEIVEIIAKKKKRIIIIEDLDRIDDSQVVLTFLKEIYRFSSLASKNKICFIVAIKPKSQLPQNNSTKNLDYYKIFDYIVDLKPIHIDDFSVILKNLLLKKKEDLSKLLGYELTEETIAHFSILAEGSNLTVRDIKHRLNNAILLYESIKEKQEPQKKIFISIKTCCIVSYLQSQYENEFYSLIKEERIFSDIIQAGYSINLKNIALEEKSRELKNKIKDLTRGTIKGNNIENFYDRLTSFILSGNINDEYRVYFYSYPKESYIKCIEEKELQDALLYPLQYKKGQSFFDSIVAKSIEVGGKTIDDTLHMIVDRDLVLPTMVFDNAQLLEYCFDKSPSAVLLSLEKNCVWTLANSTKTINTIVKINKYSFSTKSKIIMDYAERVSKTVGDMAQNALECRIGLMRALGKDIVLLKSIYYAQNSPLISADELALIKDQDTLFSIYDGTKIDSTLIIALSKWKKEKFNDKNKETLFNDIQKYISNKTLKEQTSKAIIELLQYNEYLNQDILNCILRNFSKENQELTVEYINKFKQLDDKNLIELNKLLIVDSFNQNIVDLFYNGGHYKLYLLNAIKNNFLSSRDFNINIFTQTLVKEIKKYDLELFLKYRLFLLSQSSEVKQQFAFMFSEEYPFVQENERNLISISDCMVLINTTVIESNTESFIQLIKSLAKTPLDIYVVAKHILKLASTIKLDIFSQLPFIDCHFKDLTREEKEEVLALYKESKVLNSEIEIIKYLNITGDLCEELESRILELFKLYGANNVSLSILQEYVSMLNNLKQCTNTTIEILKFIEVSEPLCSEITDKLFEAGEFKIAIIGKTLLDNSFQYSDLWNFELLLDLYTSNSAMGAVMIKNHEFLVKVYQSKKYKKLNLEQLKVYNSWGQNIKLMREVFNKMPNDEERKQYILNIHKMENLDDANELPSLFNDVKFKSLLKDDEVGKKIRDLMDNAGQGYKGYLTRLINDLRQCS